MPHMRLVTACLLAVMSVDANTADVHAADDRAHVSAEFRACMDQDADPSNWRRTATEPVPPGLELRIEGAPLVAVLPAADGGKWLAFAELRFWLPPDADVSGRIGGAIAIAERSLGAAPFSELCVDATSDDWLDRARPGIAAHLAPTPVFAQTRGLYLRRLE